MSTASKIFRSLPKNNVDYSLRYQELPPPPPREFLADGTPKKYPLNQPIHNHGIIWEKWKVQPIGLYHTVYKGEFSNEHTRFWAYLYGLPNWIAFPLSLVTILMSVHIFFSVRQIGIRPKRYTTEWVAAMKERERAENTNPVTRYLDRRKNERGPYFLISTIIPFHPHFMWMRNSHDYEAAEKMALRRAKVQETEI